MTRTISMAMAVAWLLLACAGEDGPGRTTSPKPTRSATAAAAPFEVTGSPAPPGERCPTPPRHPGYQPTIRPRQAAPGTVVEMHGNTPLFAKSGRYTGPDGKIGFWFNLPYREWVHAYFGFTPPSSNDGAPVIHLGEAHVQGKCSYAVTFAAPDVPPGRYEIVAIQHDRESSAAFQPVSFRVRGPRGEMCFGRTPTIVGTDRVDRIEGTSGVDVIATGDGNDEVEGMEGNDFVCGGGGDDFLSGGDGKDHILGGPGVDGVYGRDGADVELGGSGDDQLTGGGSDPGADDLRGGGGDDYLFGQQGDDRLAGGTGSDTLQGDGGDDREKGGPDADAVAGNVGNDVLSGGTGDDRVFGNDADDRLDGGDGTDTLNGGYGNDICVNGESTVECER